MPENPKTPRDDLSEVVCAVHVWRPYKLQDLAELLATAREDVALMTPPPLRPTKGVDEETIP